MPAIKPTRLKKTLSRMRELVQTASSSLFTCALSKRPVPIKPLGHSRVETDGSILFFTSCPLRNAENPGDQRAQLFYANEQEHTYLSITGSSEVIRDERMIRETGKELTGRDQDAVSGYLIRVRPFSAFCWDGVHGKMESLIKTSAPVPAK